jgi:hypothetical protein
MVTIMMEDGPDRYYPPEQPSEVSPMRWVMFVIIMILGAVGVYGIIAYSDTDSMLFSIFIFLPMYVFFLYATYKWAKGESIAPTNIQQDDKILDTMRRHALVAERVGGLEMYRCPDCQNSFELVNARPVDDKVVLCPFCDTRLYIE